MRFRSVGTDVGPDPGGDTISIVGPKGTPCRRNLIIGTIWEFDYGAATIEFGPLDRRYTGGAHHASQPLLRHSWCPGVYTGEAYYNVPNAYGGGLQPGASPTELYGTFRFRVLRTR